MTDNSNHTADLLALAAQGGEAALRELFDEYRDRLKRMIRLRMTGLHFWANGYCVSTIGLNEETIRRYVREQDQRERRQDQRELDFE